MELTAATVQMGEGFAPCSNPNMATLSLTAFCPIRDNCVQIANKVI